MLISIHALHEESDLNDADQTLATNQFQSTLSMRRATESHEGQRKQFAISIHALHEESDDYKQDSCCIVVISIHALHEESDLRAFRHMGECFHFNPRSP